MRIARASRVLFAAASALAAGRPAAACLVDPEFPAPTIAFVPDRIKVTPPAPALRTRRLLSPTMWTCGGVLSLPQVPAIDGLVDLFGSLANYRTAVATREISFAFDGSSVLLPCSIGVIGEPETPAATALLDLLLNDESYDWSRDAWDDDDSAFAARLTFASSAPTIAAEIAPRTGIVRILVNARETGRAKLRLDTSALELLLVRTRHSAL